MAFDTILEFIGEQSVGGGGRETVSYEFGCICLYAGLPVGFFCSGLRTHLQNVSSTGRYEPR